MHFLFFFFLKNIYLLKVVPLDLAEGKIFPEANLERGKIPHFPLLFGEKKNTGKHEFMPR